MKKNVLILQSSPRKNGNSATLAAHTADALRETGIIVETLRLHELKIAPCSHCEGCVRQKVYCIQQDDMQSIYPKLLAADAVIFASPIYWFTYNAQMKVCIDRWYGFWSAEPGFLEGKPVGVILSYGDSDLYTSGGINAISSFESLFRFLKAASAGFVFGTAGNIGDAENDTDLMGHAWELGKKIASMLSM